MTIATSFLWYWKRQRYQEQHTILVDTSLRQDRYFEVSLTGSLCPSVDGSSDLHLFEEWRDVEGRKEMSTFVKKMPVASNAKVLVTLVPL